MADSARLALTPERMRTLGYRVVDMLVRRHTRLSGKRVAGTAGQLATVARMVRETWPWLPAAPRLPTATREYRM